MPDIETMRYMLPALERLKSRGFDPAEILDVGAAHGHFAALARHAFPAARLTCVEANPESYRKFGEKLGDERHCRCLAAREEDRTFWTTRLDPTSGGCSLHREMRPGFSDEFAERVAMRTTTIDALFRDRAFDLIKVDTQGSELEILQGGYRTLDRATAVIVEMSLVQYNRGGARIEDVVAWMRDHDYALVEMCGPVEGYHWHRGRPTQVDGIFVQRHRIPACETEES